MMATAPSAIGPTIQRPEPTWVMTDDAIPANKVKSKRVGVLETASDIAGCIDHDLLAGVHRIQIDRAYLGTQQRDMLDPLFRHHQGGSGSSDAAQECTAPIRPSIFPARLDFIGSSFLWTNTAVLSI